MVVRLWTPTRKKRIRIQDSIQKCTSNVDSNGPGTTNIPFEQCLSISSNVYSNGPGTTNIPISE